MSENGATFEGVERLTAMASAIMLTLTTMMMDGVMKRKKRLKQIL
jgi:hypothetical protein